MIIPYIIDEWARHYVFLNLSKISKEFKNINEKR